MIRRPKPGLRELSWVAIFGLLASTSAGDRPHNAPQKRLIEKIPETGVVLVDRAFDAGVLVDVMVEQESYDVALLWEGPNRQLLWEVDGWTGPEGQERLRAVTEEAGRHRLILLESAPPISGGRVRVVMNPSRPATSIEHDASRAERWFWSGVLARRSARSLEARRWFEKATGVFEVLQDVTRLADCHFQWALATRDLSRTAANDPSYSPQAVESHRSEGIERFREAFRLYETRDDPFQSAAALEGIAELEEDRGHLDEAIDAFLQAIPLRERAGDPYSLAVPHQRLGLLWKKKGDLGAATDSYIEAIAVLKDAPVDDDVLAVRASAWHSRARIYLELRELPGAQTALDKALEAWRERHIVPKDQLAIAHALGTVIYALSGDFETAEEHRRQAVEFAASDYQRAVNLHNSGVLAYWRGDFEDALGLFERSFQSFDDPADRAQVRRSEANARMALGDYRSALEKFQSSVSLFEESGSAWSSHIPGIGEAEALIQLEELDRALAVLRTAVDKAEDQRRDLDDVLLQSSYFAAQQRPFELAVQIQMERGLRDPTSDLLEQAFNLVERSRGRALGDLIVDSEAEGETAEEEAERRILEKELTAILRGPMGGAGDQRDPAQMRVLLERLSTLRNQRLARNPAFRETGLREPLALSDLVAELPDDLAVLMYELGKSASYGWAVTEEGLCAAAKLPPRTEIEERAALLADGLSVPAASPSLWVKREGHAEALSQALLPPFLGCLEGRNRLLLLTEGELERIPFGYLPIPESDRRILEDYAVTRIQSITAWLALQRRAMKRLGNAEVLLLGDPAFAAGTERLHGTRREITSILPYLPPRQRHIVALGADATLSLLGSEAVAGAQVWHFATHIEIDSKEPGLSRIRLSRGEDLYAWQVHRLKMRPELVVLSGCEGVLGRQFAGEGFFGLTHAFLLSGATQVVGGLWRVDDGASAALMSGFYKHLGEGASPENALQMAQLEMFFEKGNLSDPFFWAGFVVVGGSP